MCEPVFAGNIRERENRLSASAALSSRSEVEALFVEFLAAGASFFQEFKDEPWGARDFIGLDPVGNLILFAGPSS